MIVADRKIAFLKPSCSYIKRNQILKLTMKHLYILITIILLSSCKKQCEVCEVLRNGQIIEQYESCDEEGMRTSKTICEEMAKLQDSECKCHKKDKPKTNKKLEQNVLTTIEEAKNYVTQSFDEKEETLLISDELNDKMGLNMAIIADGILKKGYMPDGFEQKDGYRIYRYNKE